MHARIATALVKPGTADHIAAGWRQMLGEYEASGAFLGMISMHQPQDDRAVTLTLWTSAEAADAVVQPLRERSTALFSDLMTGPPSIVSYDVKLTTFQGP